TRVTSTGFSTSFSFSTTRVTSTGDGAAWPQAAAIGSAASVQRPVNNERRVSVRAGRESDTLFLSFRVFGPTGGASRLLLEPCLLPSSAPLPSQRDSQPAGRGALEQALHALLGALEVAQHGRLSARRYTLPDRGEDRLVLEPGEVEAIGAEDRLTTALAEEVVQGAHQRAEQRVVGRGDDRLVEGELVDDVRLGLWQAALHRLELALDRG